MNNDFDNEPFFEVLKNSFRKESICNDKQTKRQWRVLNFQTQFESAFDASERISLLMFSKLLNLCYCTLVIYNQIELIMSQMGSKEIEKLNELRQRIRAGTKKLRTMSIAQCKYYRQFLKNHHPQKKAEYGAVCQAILMKERQKRQQAENPIKSLDYYIKLLEEKQRKMKLPTPINEQPFLANVHYPDIIVEPLIDKPTIPLSPQEGNQKIFNEETTFSLTRSSSNNSEEQKIEVVELKEKQCQARKYYNIKLMQSEENSKKQSVEYNTWDDYLNEEDTPFLKKHFE